MNRECRWCCGGPINFQKRYLFRGTRKGAHAVLTARRDNQAGLGSFDSDFLTNVGSAFTLSARVAEKDFLPVKKAKRRHNVRCNRELNARRGHGIP